MTTLNEVIKKHNVKMNYEQVDSNKHMDDFRGDHYKCVLTCGGKKMTVPFSKGYGHHGKAPEVSEVMECMLSDYSCAGDSFEDFCGNCGYDIDSRKAEKIYKNCSAQSKKLAKFLGDNLDEFISAEV